MGESNNKVDLLLGSEQARELSSDVDKALVPDMIRGHGRESLQPLALDQAHKPDTVTLPLEHEPLVPVAEGASSRAVPHVADQPREVALAGEILQPRDAVVKVVIAA